MLRIACSQRSSRYCDGISRRSFLQVGMAGVGGLTLPQLLQAKQASATVSAKKRDTAVILIWLDGGPSHMDTYDLKPEAPEAFRGFFKPIATNVPGFDVSELFPLQAKVADRFSVIRSLHHDSGDHFAGAHVMLTGYWGATGGNTASKYPGIGAIAAKLRGSNAHGIPPYVGIPYGMSVGIRPGYFGANYLGVSYNPFEVGSDPNAANFQINNLNLPGGMDVPRLDDRWALMRSFDQLRRDLDRAGNLGAIDEFQQEAYGMVASDASRRAFDISKEDPRLRDRYGRNSWGQSVLLARRLVEAGAMFTTCHFGGWDHHWNLEGGYRSSLPRVDQAVSALIEDLTVRGMLDRVMFMVVGEFGRTPRLNNGGNGGPPLSKGTPGRDHWGNAMACMIGGGGLKGGQIVGATSPKGEYPAERPIRPEDVLATVYHVLGIDPTQSFLNHAGRPIPILPGGEVIGELV